MRKYIFILTAYLLLFKTVDAQHNTKVFYLKNSGRFVSTRDSADYFLYILPPDSTVNKKLFIVKEFYNNGKLRLVGNSLTNSSPLKFHGSQVTFFSNGHKMRIKSFDNGIPVGDVIEYYPNGKFYNLKTYVKSNFGGDDLMLKNCSDSTGKILAENGNGYWLNFLDENFADRYTEGPIKDGMETGEWRSYIYGIKEIYIFRKGRLISSKSNDKPNDVQQNKLPDDVPQFPGGAERFGSFLSKKLRFPEVAIEQRINGRVIIAFIVEADGTLTDIKLDQGIGYGCDEEALRIMKSSPRWIPAKKEGKPVRTPYKVPIVFSVN
jgi:TonB family protein